MRSTPSRLRRARRTGLAMLAIVLTAVPAQAAVAPPTILTAGIDAADQLHATWSLAAGTTFEFVEFATVPTPDPVLPIFFADNNFAGFACAPPPASCTSAPSTTSYTAAYPIVRDRRYFVKVVATAGGESAPSAIWVIDEAKPLVPGDAPNNPNPPSGLPATGREFSPAVVQPAPAAALSVPKVPAKLANLRAFGVKVRVDCPAACSGAATLSFNGIRIGRRAFSFTSAGVRTVTVKLSAAGKRRLRRRSRARLKISATATPAGGAKARVSRTFTVRR